MRHQLPLQHSTSKEFRVLMGFASGSTFPRISRRRVRHLVVEMYNATKEVSLLDVPAYYIEAKISVEKYFVLFVVYAARRVSVATCTRIMQMYASGAFCTYVLIYLYADLPFGLIVSCGSGRGCVRCAAVITCTYVRVRTLYKYDFLSFS